MRIKVKVKRCLLIWLLPCMLIMYGCPLEMASAYECIDAEENPASAYDSYSNQTAGWGLMTNTSHEVPVNAGSEIFEKRNARYYVKTDEKAIYLTFDCGYENGFTPKILDTLAQNDVKALFFVTKPYIAENAKLVKRMKEEGHLVGNHTCRHLSTPSLGVDEIRDELKACSDYMKKKTGYEMDPYFRPPMGEWSKRTLKVAQDMGYSTIFWSMAFMDYDVENQPGKDVIYKQFMTNYHKGAIPLLHGISQSDTEALDSIINSMEELGYRFATLDELVVKEQRLSVVPRQCKSNGKRISLNVRGLHAGSSAYVQYYDMAGRVMDRTPTRPGIYYAQAFSRGNSEYRPAVSKKVRFKVLNMQGQS